VKPEFDSYAAYYDLLYGDKDYAAEAAYVAGRLRQYTPDVSHVLELGCGTGMHAHELALLGFDVTGIDISPAMCARAEGRRKAQPHSVAERLAFRAGDLRTMRLGRTFDAVIALFHVMSFQATLEDLHAAFRTAAVHLEPGGVFLFDFWYGPAVLAQRPEPRMKHIQYEGGVLTRASVPHHDMSRNTVRVEYTITVSDHGRDVVAIEESHTLRYWFPADLTAASAGLFREISTYAWLTRSPADTTAWSAVQVLSRLPD
jgi:SAM-dependent methyltransferase